MKTKSWSNYGKGMIEPWSNYDQVKLILLQEHGILAIQSPSGSSSCVIAKFELSHCQVMAESLSSHGQVNAKSWLSH